MTGMFNGAKAFSQDLSGWDVAKISEEAYYFDDLSSSDWTDDKKPQWGTTGKK